MKKAERVKFMILLLVLSAVISTAIFATIIYPIAANMIIALTLIMIAFLSAEGGSKVDRMMDGLVFSSFLLILDSIVNYIAGQIQISIAMLAVAVFALATVLTIIMIELFKTEL